MCLRFGQVNFVILILKRLFLFQIPGSSAGPVKYSIAMWLSALYSLYKLALAVRFSTLVKSLLYNLTMLFFQVCMSLSVCASVCLPDATVAVGA